MACVVVNKYKSAFDIYIGRGSQWGNPFVIGKHGSRVEVIQKYRQHLWRQVESGEVSVDDLLALDGKRLGCFCKPQACHGDVIASAVEWAKTQKGGLLLP